jgi:hypothetical protein
MIGCNSNGFNKNEVSGRHRSCRADDASLIDLLKRIVDPNPAPRVNEPDECMRRTPECPSCGAT